VKVELLKPLVLFEEEVELEVVEESEDAISSLEDDEEFIIDHAASSAHCVDGQV
jgi:hypothetical protein